MGNNSSSNTASYEPNHSSSTDDFEASGSHPESQSLATTSNEFAKPPRAAQNGVTLPERRHRTPRNTSSKQKHIAAIDFGTSSCSLACWTANPALHDQSCNMIKFSEEDLGHRVPTAVLIDEDGVVVKFGADAEYEWINYCDSASERDRYFFFKQIKMELLRNKVMRQLVHICLVRSSLDNRRVVNIGRSHAVDFLLILSRYNFCGTTAYTCQCLACQCNN